MTPPNKPEWIHLAESDSAPQVKKSARALPALVLAAAMSIVGLGALVAQNGAETPAIASEQGINLSAATSPDDPAAPQLPGIASMPTGDGDDENGYEDVDEEDDEEEYEEGEEDDEDDDH
jgi:hypothetical protein